MIGSPSEWKASEILSRAAQGNTIKDEGKVVWDAGSALAETAIDKDAIGKSGCANEKMGASIWVVPRAFSRP